MMSIYAKAGDRLEEQRHGAPVDQAIWIDCLDPQPEDVQIIEALGTDVPSRQEMEEIELSNRLYHDENALYMTVILPGMNSAMIQVSGPVTLILSEHRLITLRYHTPHPFLHFPLRSEKSASGCSTPARLMVGLTEELIGNHADLLEGIGRALDDIGGKTFDLEVTQHQGILGASLMGIGQQGERLNRLRLGLLTLERALSHFSQMPGSRAEGPALPKMVAAQLRDIESLEAHADFVSQRIGLAAETTLGMINLAQNSTARIVSVVATLFMPPTLIASIYGMNFGNMPELQSSWGYPIIVAIMICSALGTYRYFRWKGWL